MADTRLRNPRRKKGGKFQRKDGPLPVPIESITHKTCCDERWFYYTGHFRDTCVVVEDPGDLVFLYRMGFFGKGNLSRSKPEYDVISNISQKAFSKSEKLRRLPPKERRIRQSKFREIRKERFRNHSQWKEKAVGLAKQLLENTDNSKSLDLQSKCSEDTTNACLEDQPTLQPNEDEPNSTIGQFVPPDVNDEDDNDTESSDDDDHMEEDEDEQEEAQVDNNKDVNEVILDVLRSTKGKSEEVEIDDVLKPLKVEKKEDPYKVFEQLHLSLEEAFFLSYGLGCLQVYNEETPMNLSEMWQAFCAAKTNFLPCYIVYHYLRSKGWVPKTGSKYGTDFVIYKQGMPFYHSSYSVVVQQVNEETLDVSTPQDRPLTWCNLCGLSRVNEHAAKEVMICYVIKPKGITQEELLLPRCVPRFKVQEVIMRRWVPERAREPDKT